MERILDVEARLLSNKIDSQAALVELCGPKQKPWATPWWKKQRAKLLASECSRCGSATPPLVLQHVWHPPSFSECLKQAGGIDWEQWKLSHPIVERGYIEYPMIEKSVCPSCGSSAIRWYKTRDEWQCNGNKHKGGHRSRAFDTPARAMKRGSKGTQEDTEERARYMVQAAPRREAWFSSPEYRERHQRAVLIAIENSKRYLSLVDTTTWCRRCAFREDAKFLQRRPEVLLFDG